MNFSMKSQTSEEIEKSKSGILKYILDLNSSQINQTLHSSIFQNVPCKFYQIDIKIDLINLCNIFPEETYLISKNIYEFNCILYRRIKEIINEFYDKNEIKNSKLLFFEELFDMIIIVEYAPILSMRREIKEIYSMVKSKYEKNEDVICKTELSLFCVKGNFTKVKTVSEFKSAFYLCNNNLCDDKTYILQLKNITYIFKDSKKTFILVSSNDKKICYNCKSKLTEKVNLRVYSSIYEYICTDGVYNISCVSNSELPVGTKFSLGTIRRRKGGNIYFQILNNYEEKIEICKYYILRMNNSTLNSSSILRVNRIEEIKFSNTMIKDLELYLLQITKFIFTPIKSNCDMMDALLFIILNICTYKPTKLLLFTTDPLYVNRCAYNLFKIKNAEIKIFSEIKSLKNNNGLCVRGYTERNTKITNLEIDYIFHLPLNHFLDYSYSLNYHDLYIENIRKDLEDDVQNKNLQILFIEFRKVYKSLIEPERLLNMLKSIYLSIIEFIETDYDDLSINNFIIKRFIDKLI